MTLPLILDVRPLKFCQFQWIGHDFRKRNWNEKNWSNQLEARKFQSNIVRLESLNNDLGFRSATTILNRLNVFSRARVSKAECCARADGGNGREIVRTQKQKRNRESAEGNQREEQTKKQHQRKLERFHNIQSMSFWRSRACQQPSRTVNFGTKSKLRQKFYTKILHENWTHTQTQIVLGAWIFFHRHPALRSWFKWEIPAL